MWNIGKTARKFWVLSISKSELKFRNTDFIVKNENRNGFQ